MNASAKPKSSREDARKRRERLRDQGLRLIQIWVPDTRSDAFAKEAHRQSRIAGTSQHEAEDQAFVDAVSEWNDPDSAAIYAYEWPDEK